MIKEIQQKTEEKTREKYIKIRLLFVWSNQSICKSILNIHWKDWHRSWSSNTLAIWYKRLTHWKRPWCWERLRARGEAGGKGWDGWMASLIQMNISLSKLREIVRQRSLTAAVHGVTKSWTQVRHWTTRLLFEEFWYLTSRSCRERESTHKK